MKLILRYTFPLRITIGIYPLRIDGNTTEIQPNGVRSFLNQ